MDTNIPSAWRGKLYILNIVLAVVAIALAVLIVLGVITQDQVLAVVTIGLALYGAFTSGLARLNLTPDA